MNNYLGYRFPKVRRKEAYSQKNKSEEEVSSVIKEDE
jgi:hypothetical protein